MGWMRYPGGSDHQNPSPQNNTWMGDFVGGLLGFMISGFRVLGLSFRVNTFD